jgi:hypothetical protein
VTEQRPVIAHVGSGDRVEEYPLEGIYAASEVRRGADCRMWVNGSGNGRSELFTFELLPRR